MKAKSIIIILLLAIIVNFKILKAPFLYDDKDIIVLNKDIQNLNNIKRILSSDYYSVSKEVSFRPLVTLVHFLNYHLWKGKVLGFRIVELLIYLAVVILVYIVGLRLFNNEPLAFISAIIFAAHPVHSEALGCVALGFGELLCCLFLLLAFLYHIKTVEQYNADNIIFTFLFWILALLSKETAIVFPVFVFVHLKTKSRRLSVGYISAYLFIGIIYLFVRFSVMKLPELKYVLYVGGSFYNNFLSMSYVLLQYLSLLIFPLKLAVEPQPVVISTILNTRAVLGITTIICIIIFCIALLKQKNWILLVLFSWIIIPLIPAMNLIPFLKAVLLNIRYLFIPSIGFCWLLGILFVKLNPQKLSVKSFIILLIICFSIRTMVRNFDWADEIRLWKKEVKMYPNFSRAHLSLGSAYIKNGRIADALKEYETVTLIEPDNPEAYYNIGVILTDKSDIKSAEKFLIKACEIVKNYPQDASHILSIVAKIYLELASLYEKKGDTQQALFFYDKTGKKNIYLAEKMLEDAKKCLDTQKYNEATELIKKAQELYPQSPRAYNMLAAIYNKTNMPNEAITAANKSLEITQVYALPYFQIGTAYRTIGDKDAAIKYYKEGLALMPENIDANFDLANLYGMKKQYKQAAKYFAKIIELQPRNMNIYNYLAICYVNLNKPEKAKEIMETALLIEPENKTVKENYEIIKKIIKKGGTKK